jgi:Icc-related predicted phosphoesterase
MKITAVSDLHGEFPELEGGDVLIIAGDCTSNDSIPAWNDFFKWLEHTHYRKRIVIGGNHDNFCRDWAIHGLFTEDEYERMYPGESPFFDYLCDSGLCFEGVSFWGSPWSLWFNGINPHCKAFTGTEADLKKKFDLIPNDLDILITHSPPYGILDEVKDRNTGYMRNCGSVSLREKIEHVKPLYNVFGHIHEHGGKSVVLKTPGKDITCVNSSQVDGDYIFNPNPFHFQL